MLNSELHKMRISCNFKANENVSFLNKNNTIWRKTALSKYIEWTQNK